MLLLKTATNKNNKECRWCNKTIWADTKFTVAIAIPQKKFFGNYHDECLEQYLLLNKQVKVNDTREKQQPAA